MNPAPPSSLLSPSTVSTLVPPLVPPLPQLPREGLRTGIDIVQISRIEASFASFGERFAQRLFTPGEIAYASAEPTLAAQRFAARFAAKEAAIKAFGLSHTGIDWRDIEVVRAEDGRCDLRLHGEAARAAGEPAGDGIALSLSHDGDYAIAIVVVAAPTPSTPSNH